MKKIRAGIIGGAGYTGGELIRLLLLHPQAEIVFVQSRSNAGRMVSDVHTDLIAETELAFCSAIQMEIDVLFLCLGHGEAKVWLSENAPLKGIKIIDLSQDHRIDDLDFLYGLPERNKQRISAADKIANPGCFATCIQLGVLPLASNGLLKGEVHVNATTGSTGAGQSLSGTSHFSWRESNLSTYKAFEHQHLKEIRRNLDFFGELNFIPQRGAFTRGIFASIYLDSEQSEKELQDLYSTFYKPHPFVKISEKDIDLKQVINTNNCLIRIAKHQNKIFITACIDNLLKGASGQAVQNMNLMFGFEETAGLKLKASVY